MKNQHSLKLHDFSKFVTKEHCHWVFVVDDGNDLQKKTIHDVNALTISLTDLLDDMTRLRKNSDEGQLGGSCP
jgi:hypothetical protein